MNEAVRYAIMASLVYSTWLVYKCPCDKPVNCSKTQFYAATDPP